MELFTFSQKVGQGLPLWLPNGSIIIDELETLAKETEDKEDQEHKIVNKCSHRRDRLHRENHRREDPEEAVSSNRTDENVDKRSPKQGPDELHGRKRRIPFWLPLGFN